MSLDCESKKSLRQKVEDAELSLLLKNRSDNAAMWAEAQIKLSDALIELADVEENDETALGYFNQAANGLENALKVYTRKDNFSRWGGTVVSYVKCLRNQSLREGGEISTLRLKRCLVLLDQVYKALPKVDNALDRAFLFAEKGHVFRALADVEVPEKRLSNLEHALTFFDSSSAILREKENFHHWALVMSTSAFVAGDLARMRITDTARQDFENAITRFEMALAYFNRDNCPNDLPYIYMEMGRLLVELSLLAEKSDSSSLLQKAIDTFELAGAAFKENVQDKVLMRLNNEKATAFSCLAQEKNGVDAIELLEKSVSLYKENLNLLGEKGDRVITALLYGKLGKDLTQLANLESEPSISLNKRYQAIAALQRAVCKEVKNVRPLDWLSYYIELGAALQAAGNLEVSEKCNDLFQQAIKLYSEVLHLISESHDNELVIKVYQWRALARAHLGESILTNEGLSLLKQAELDFRMALAKLDQNACEQDSFRLNVNLAHLLYTMACHKDSEGTLDMLKSADEAIVRALSLDENKVTRAEDERLAALNHRSLILWRIGTFSGDLEAFSMAQEVYQNLIEEPLLQNNLISLSNIKSNYALMLQDWSRNVAVKEAKIHLTKALELMTELYAFADAKNDEQMHKQYKANIEKLEKKLAQMTRRRWFNFWPLNKF